ncbi:MAG: tRNA (adenosine(37)-N6)-dimethylallyltransferase, partial [Sphingomonadales bacterium]
IAPSIRSGIMAAYEKEGIGWLQRALATEDPRFAATGEMRNPQRMMRALEVMRSTQKSILTFRRGQVKRQPYELVAIGLQLPRHELYLRIDQRVDKMMSDGWLSEVESLIKYKELNALNTVGYKELFQYLQKDISLQEAIALIKQNTRLYAKRQMTWFTKDPHFRWFSPAQEKELISSL